MSKVFKIIEYVLPSRWVCGDYWLRIPFLRKTVGLITLLGNGILGKKNILRKIREIDRLISPVLVDRQNEELFRARGNAAQEKSVLDIPLNSSGRFNRRRAAGKRKSGFFASIKKSTAGILARCAAFLKKESPAFLVPRSRLSGMIRSGLSNTYSPGEKERCFYIDNLIRIDERIDHYAGAKGRETREKIFTRSRLEKLAKTYPEETLNRPFPESFLVHYLPDFRPDEFIRHRARFIIRKKRLFSMEEINGVARFLAESILCRDGKSRAQRFVIASKKWSLVTAAVILAVPLLMDLILTAYGIYRNDFFFGNIHRPHEIVAMRSPYAERANRVYLMNNTADYSGFSMEGDGPGDGILFRMVKTGRPAIDLSYGSYREMRMNDQSGLTILAVDRDMLEEFLKGEYARYRPFLDKAVMKTLPERILWFFDDLTGNRFAMLRLKDIGYERIAGDILSRASGEPAPLRWIDEINRTCPCVTVIYHKANVRKWMDLDDLPVVMKKGLILREDRRFYNDLLPVPHRGNDLPVILPQIVKKVAHDFLVRVAGFGESHHIAWIQKKVPRWIGYFRERLSGDMRGGSSISNQLMELLYTRYITDTAPGDSLYEKKTEQKKYELSASAVLHWFWSKDEILEAYVNEVFGGYLHGHIIGLRSQAETYFSRSLGDLNLREQMLLVGAVKKPSYVKEYARYLKAWELDELVRNREGDVHERAGRWERENLIYGINRSNYRQVMADDRIARWIMNRTDHILFLLYRDGAISGTQYLHAMGRDMIRFDFHPAVYSMDNRLVNNIRNEVDLELGQGRSDSGMVMNTTINVSMQRGLQRMVDGEARRVYVDEELRLNGQPATVAIDGGSRIIWANRRDSDGRIQIVNRIVADVGGSSRGKSDWDWVTMANRSLGSSLKPLLDLYFVLDGYNLSDLMRNKKMTYANYTLEQQMSYRNYILKYPHKKDEIRQIRDSWSWTPENYRGFTGDWITVKDSLVYSVNSVHAQIQEIVTPETFAELLNETMNIRDPAMKHTTYRSLILGGSDGDQRYDKYLLAFSLFANGGKIIRHTFIDSLHSPAGTRFRPMYRPLDVPVLQKFSREEIEAAVLLINSALRETVVRGSMAAMRSIGAGKTGTSNDLRDAVATLHFVNGEDTYIAGIRLGNEKNYSIGRAAHEIATPALSKIVRGLFGESSLLRGEEYDGYIKGLLQSHPQITGIGTEFYLKKAEPAPRKIDVARIMEERRNRFLVEANRLFIERKYAEAASLYENFLMLTSNFDSDNPAFRNMMVCYIKLNNIERVNGLIMHFTSPSKMKYIASVYEEMYGVDIHIDKRLAERMVALLNKSIDVKSFLSYRTTEELRLLTDDEKGPGEKSDSRNRDMHIPPQTGERNDGDLKVKMDATAVKKTDPGHILPPNGRDAASRTGPGRGMELPPVDGTPSVNAEK